MRRHILLLLLVLPAAVLGQTPELNCTACRDVRAYPMDFGNHAFNEVFAGTQIDGTAPLGASVIVKNALGQSALVYLYRVMEDSGLSLGIPPFFYFQVPYPSPYVGIAVQDAWGTLTTYQVLISTPYLIVGGYEEVAPKPGPAPDADEPDPVTLDKSSGGLDLLGGYDASANYYGGIAIPYYDIRLYNE